MRLAKHRGKYVVYSNTGGRVTRRSLGTTDAQEASRLFEEYKASLALREASKGFTVTQLWERYSLYLTHRPIIRTLGSLWKHILPTFGHLAPHQITIEMCEQYAKDHKVLRSTSSISKELRMLRACLLWAVKRKLITSAPHISAPTPGPPKRDYITKDQARHLLETITAPHIRLFVILALSTGARHSALLQLTWDRVDLTARIVDLRTEDMSDKKGRATVPINDKAFDILSSTPENERLGEVIKYHNKPIKSIDQGLGWYTKTAGLAFVTPHVLRHSAAVWMAEEGIGMEEIAQFLGHADINITRKIYAIFSPTYLRKAAKALEF